MSTELALTLLALLLSLWALNWARRAANAVERTAVAAEKSALASERSALAARRAAEAVEAHALAARATTSPDAAAVVDVEAHARAARIDAVVRELIDGWPRDASAWPLVERNPGLAEDEVEQIIQKAFHLMGRTEAEARQHSVAVLNMRRDRLRLGAPV
jgi:hypothetical protein